MQQPNFQTMSKCTKCDPNKQPSIRHYHPPYPSSVGMFLVCSTSQKPLPCMNTSQMELKMWIMPVSLPQIKFTHKLCRSNLVESSIHSLVTLLTFQKSGQILGLLSDLRPSWHGEAKLNDGSACTPSQHLKTSTHDIGLHCPPLYHAL